MLRKAKGAPLALALLIVLGGTTATLWLAFARDARPVVRSGSTSETLEAVVSPASAADGGDLASPTIEPASVAGSAGPGSTAVRTEASAAEAADVIEVEGRVLFPTGTPIDEEAFVVARTSSSQRVRVGSDGGFRISFPKRTRKARLDLEARYLYLEHSVAVEPRKLEDPITLEPLLGGCFEVTLVPPSLDEAVVNEIRSSLIYCSGVERIRETNDGRRVPKGTIGTDLVARFGGLSQHFAYGVRIEPRTLVQAGIGGVCVEAGAIERVELRLEQGVGVSGRVVDEQGVGVADARVEGWNGELGGVLDGEPWARSHRTAQTGADGSFELTGLAPGALFLEASKDGFGDTELGPWELVVGQDFADLSIVLGRGGVIAGFVRWPDGSPAEAVLLPTLEESLEPEGSVSFLRLGRDLVRTSEEGRFELTGMPLGIYAIEATGGARPESDRQEEGEGTWHVQRSGIATGTHDLVLVLQQSQSISGRVLDDTGAPLENFRVHALPVGMPDSVLAGHLIMSGATDGAFHLHGLYPGAWRVSAETDDMRSAETLITLPVDTAELVFIVPRAAQVSGRVVDLRGEGVPKASVSARFAEPLRLRFDEPEAQRTRASGEGVFRLRQIPPGPVQIVADAAELGESEALVLDLSPGEVREGIVLALRAGATLEIELASSIRGRADRSVSILGRSEQEKYRTDVTGRVVVEDVDPGHYWIQLLPGPGASEEFGVSASAEVAPGQRTLVVLGEPGEGAIRLSGRVSHNGEPLVGVWIQFLSLEVETVAGWTDEAGRYEVAVGSPGEYSVGVGGRLGSWRTTAVVPHTTEHVLDFAIPSGSVSGRVLGQDGSPLEKVGVFLARVDTEAPWSAVFPRIFSDGNFSRRDGAFSFPFVMSGRYVVVADATWPRKGLGGSRSSGLAISAEIEIDGENAVEDLELRLHEPGNVLVVVRNANGLPVVGARIELATPGGSSSALGWGNDGPITNAAGSALVEAPGTGAVSLLARLGERQSAVVEAPVLAGRTSEAKLVLGD